MKKRKKSKPPVATRAADLVNFIEAHGGRLRQWEAYRIRPETVPPAAQAAPSDADAAQPPAQ